MVIDTAKTNMEAFWDVVKSGRTFQYVMDDTVAICGDGTVCGDGTICAVDSDGSAVPSTSYIVESTELVFSPAPVYGYWTTTLRMREAV